MRAGHDEPPDIARTASSIASGRGMSRQTSGNVVYTSCSDIPTGGNGGNGGNSDFSSKEEIGIELVSDRLRRGNPLTDLGRESADTRLLRRESSDTDL